MTTSQKAALSLLISVLLFGAFTALTYTGLFDLIEARFYNPSITNSLNREISRNAETIDGFLIELQTRFSGTLKDSSIRRSFLPDQRTEDIYERSRIYGLLLESVSGMQGIRFIDSGGTRIHFSTFGSDILQQDRQSISYRSYNEPDFPYEKIAVGNGGIPKYTLDEDSDRIIFSFPFYDSYEVYRGTAVFSISVRAVSEMLIMDGRLKVGQDISIISNPPGFLSGMSTSIEKTLSAQVASIWAEGGMKVTRLDSPNSDTTLALITVRTSQGFFVGRLINEELFSFPQTMKIILLASFFITVYLTIFLLFNIRQDSVTIVQNRLKQLQISLIEQYYERKGDMDWSRWSRELEQRRDEIGEQLKRGIKTASGGRKNDIDALVDKSWDELIAVIGGRKDTTLDEDKLQIILNRILSALPNGAAPIQISPQITAPQPSARQSQTEEAPKEAEPVEIEEVELEEIEEAEAVEELAEESEPVEIEEIEEAEAVEELTEEAVPIEIVEAAEPVNEIEELEEIPELEELEETESDEVMEDTIAAPVSGAQAEVPIIDMADMNLSSGMVDEVVQVFDSGEDIIELEELDEVEEAGEPEEEKNAADSFSEVKDSQPESLRENIEKLASQIEFSPVIEQESPEDDSLHDDFEIVSPFATILFDFSMPADRDAESSGEEKEKQEAEEPAPINEEVEFLDTVDDEEKNNTQDNLKNAELEENVNITQGVSLIYKPFFQVTDDKGLEALEALPGENDEDTNIGTLDIIEEREGVHYISNDALNSDSGQDVPINKDFKNLVDSVIK